MASFMDYCQWKRTNTLADQKWFSQQSFLFSIFPYFSAINHIFMANRRVHKPFPGKKRAELF